MISFLGGIDLSLGERVCSYRKNCFDAPRWQNNFVGVPPSSGEREYMIKKYQRIQGQPMGGRELWSYWEAHKPMAATNAIDGGECSGNVRDQTRPTRGSDPS
jgi:hypothetical protein